MTGIEKWAITFLGLNLQQEFAQGLKELLKLPHGKPASVSGLLTQEVLIPCGSWVVGRALDLLGEALTNLHFISFLLRKGRCQIYILEKTWALPAHCQHPRGGKLCISPLACPSTQRARVTHIRPKRKTLLSFSEQASWARHHDEPSRRSVRSSNHFFNGEVHLKLSFLPLETFPQYHGKTILFHSSNERWEEKEMQQKMKGYETCGTDREWGN